jgi:hypothetical protein
MDKQTLVTVERFHLSDERYAPFFMDTSASARVCGLIRQSLLLEEGRVLYLLAGAPRRWLEEGKEIKLTMGVTTAAKVDFSVKSRVSEGKILVDLTMTELYVGELESLRVRVPHPLRQPMKEVLVNGRPWARFNPEEETIELTPASGRTEIAATY